MLTGITISSCIFHCSLTLDERFTLVRSVGEECIQDDELKNLLLKKKDPVCYDGFEPSGRMHIAQVFLKPDKRNS